MIFSSFRKATPLTPVRSSPALRCFRQIDDCFFSFSPDNDIYRRMVPQDPFCVECCMVISNQRDYIWVCFLDFAAKKTSHSSRTHEGREPDDVRILLLNPPYRSRSRYIPIAGWSKTETSMPSCSKTEAKYRIPKGGNEASAFLSPLASRLSLGEAFTKATFKVSLTSLLTLTSQS